MHSAYERDSDEEALAQVPQAGPISGDDAIPGRGNFMGARRPHACAKF